MKVVSVAVSPRTGTGKTPVPAIRLIAGRGIEGDAHAGDWHRQVSLLAAERIEEVREAGVPVSYGDYAENVATVGIDWKTVPVGTRVRLGAEVEIEITQIGKKCHSGCEIARLTGDCIMPREGVFARVLAGGTVAPGDTVELAPAVVGK
ncbi:MAG TPA: MOSC domain-containing protein [bacterium]|nr:MOSC domain-containing protein [bacterium]HPJ71707.1 MOSC domain-containing protein [bacterium]HPQ66336.1 MOSC domain-containing protein [bacterium]